MNWFQRYGIPGAYFLGFTMACVFALSDLTITNTDFNFKVLVALAVITFLPVGYIISIFQQWIYYTCPSLGMHKIAKNNASFGSSDFPNDEPSIEAYTVKLIWDHDNELTLEKHKFINEWIRRRMDVVAINFSLLISTPLSCVIAIFITQFFLQWEYRLLQIVFIIIISIALLIIFLLNMCVLRKQIIKVIIDFYERKKESLVFIERWGLPKVESKEQDKEKKKIEDGGFRHLIIAVVAISILFILGVGVANFYKQRTQRGKILKALENDLILIVQKSHEWIINEEEYLKVDLFLWNTSELKINGKLVFLGRLSQKGIEEKYFRSILKDSDKNRLAERIKMYSHKRMDKHPKVVAMQNYLKRNLKLPEGKNYEPLTSEQIEKEYPFKFRKYVSIPPGEITKIEYRQTLPVMWTGFLFDVRIEGIEF